MRFLLADSFTGALARLPTAEAKAVKTTVVDLQIDPPAKDCRSTASTSQRTRISAFVAAPEQLL